MSIEDIRNKKVGYLRVSQCIPLSQRGQGTIGGYTQRMAILRLIEEAGCQLTFLSEVLKDDLDILERKGWGYEPLKLDLKDDYDVLLVENAATHNLFFSSMYKDLPKWFSENPVLPLIQVQDRRVATFKGERIYWQCLDPMLLRALWSSAEDQERLGKITTVWHGALSPDSYIARLKNRVLLFSHCNDWRFFSASRFDKFMPINPVEKRNLTITYLGSQRPRKTVFKDIYYSDTLIDYDVNIVGRAWSNELVDEAPCNVKFWNPIPQWDTLHLLNQSKYTITIGDKSYEKSSWHTTRQLEAIYGNCILLVSDKYVDPMNHVMDERLVVNGSNVGNAIKWLEEQNFIDLIHKQRDYFKPLLNKLYADEYSMF